MKAFIVRPFGKKKGVDFEKVHKKLIEPALLKAGIEGYTTGVICEAGNIRRDMFQLLLTSDLVIADISIHNANVFYELGIRHALREGSTILIRSSQDEVPFDLKTDRYLSYQITDLGGSVDKLYNTINSTLTQRQADSPVFMMLPALKSQDPETFLAIPSDFSRELALAKNSEDRGKLRLLAFESGHFPWAVPALRVIAKEQYGAGYYKDARETWESIKKRNPDDIETNFCLATIYHRLSDREIPLNPDLADGLLAKSEEAIAFLFDRSSQLTPGRVAEVYALKARNEKSRWLGKWRSEKPTDMPVAAIRSGFLKSAYVNYLNGYSEDLNHFYSGVNALGLLKVMLELAEREPKLWAAKYESAEEAKKALKGYKKEFDHLAVVVRKAIASEIKKLERADKKDAWVAMTKADLALLTETNVERIRLLYSEAINAGGGLNFDSARRQLLIYEKLGVVPENVNAALSEFGDPSDKKSSEDINVILFAGHMIDSDDRPKPRFPKEKETEVRAKIKAKLIEILDQHPEDEAQTEKSKMFLGIAGGACGGDILFHEVCKELGIKTKVLLALPREQFVARSVSFAGNRWISGFNALNDDVDTRFMELTDMEELPDWLKSNNFKYSFWERNNQWVLNTAFAIGGNRLTFLALWNGKGGDGPGGTKNMIEEVKSKGAKSIVISP